jgi:hypothetical protein
VWLGKTGERVDPRRFTVLLLAGLVILYVGWLTYVIVADRPLDFYVYYRAAEATARGQSPYTISDPAWDALAADLHHQSYPPLPLSSLHGGGADPVLTIGAARDDGGLANL